MTWNAANKPGTPIAFVAGAAVRALATSFPCAPERSHRAGDDPTTRPTAFHPQVPR